MPSRMPGSPGLASTPAGQDSAGLRTTLRKVAASLTTVALAGGLMAFAHFGDFADAHDPFPPSVVAHR